MKHRKLSLRQAIACEQGAATRCRCRCKGALHNARRFGDAPAAVHFWLHLNADDPHHIRRPVGARVPRRYPLIEVIDAPAHDHAPSHSSMAPDGKGDAAPSAAVRAGDGDDDAAAGHAAR